MLLDDPTAPHRIDLKTSTFDVKEVTDASVELSEAQKSILAYFHDKTEGKRLVCRSDLKPNEMVKYLPNVALYDIEYDDRGEVSDVICRLFGTVLAGFYGEFTGLSVHSEIVKNASPDLQYRLLLQVNAAVNYRNAVTSVATASFGCIAGMRIFTLTIPMATNDSDIDKIFMYIEVETKK